LVDGSAATNAATGDEALRAAGETTGHRIGAAANLRATFGPTGDVLPGTAVAVSGAEFIQAADAGRSTACEELIAAGVVSGSAGSLQGIATHATDFVAIVSRTAAAATAADLLAADAASVRIGRTGLIALAAHAGALTADLTGRAGHRLALPNDALVRAGSVRGRRTIACLATTASGEVGTVPSVGSAATAGFARIATDIVAVIATEANLLGRATGIVPQESAVAEGVAATIDTAAVLRGEAALHPIV